MIQLILVRHAPAGEPDPKRYPDDSARPLTQTGIRKFKKAAEGMSKMVKPDAVLTSPTSRTMQTADLLHWDGGWPGFVADEALLDDHTPKDVVKAIKGLAGKPSVIGLVGHGPALEQLAKHLTNQDVDLHKGGAAMIEMPSRTIKKGSGSVKWAMRRKELKKLR